MIFTENPFYILDASPRDNKRVIREKAEEKMFFEDEELCRNAERLLLNPQKRLEAEISWFIGISPKKAKSIIETVTSAAESNIFDYDFFSQLDVLSYANIMAVFLSKITEDTWTEDEVENLVREFCDTVKQIDIANAIELINEDRIAAGFPEITDYNTADDACNNLYRYYKDVLYLFLNLFDSCFIVNVLTNLIEDITDNGNEECPWQLLDDIITAYEMDAIPFFEKQEEKINTDMEAIISALEQKIGNDQLSEHFENLKNDVLLWDRIAQPVQVLLKSQGMNHSRSDDLSDMLRSLALKAHNDFGCTALSLRITELQQYVFAELRDVIEKAADDKKQLEEIVKQQDIAKEKHLKEEQERKKALSYFKEWGLILKKSVKFDAECIVINGTERYDIKNISGISWGAVRTSVNGIPTGTKYYVHFYYKRYPVRIPIKNDEMYSDIIELLIKSVGENILSHWLDKLKNDGEISIGDITIYNDSITLKKDSWFSFEMKRIPFDGISLPVTADGKLYVYSKDGKYGSKLSYQDDYNTYILNMILHTVLKSKDKTTVSSAFGMEK